ncbi:DUF948 domain-containing protein [Planomicrobium sp. Y74]|uniref:DUF948 domain-containing protein n=1 Tax=Planomicrobium sp. Y74 TaxID=2478977 RepID=UPI000EF48AEA|nr:DUF948 domain-containing protein [Planomicrobium sp. Y74]RLQ92198.1 DUF948 domain-containing protein [Planomicrobium sp. Y74]
MDSTIWWWIALGILVLGLIIAIIGVVLFIKGLKEPMKKIKGSADNLKERVDGLNLEVSSLTHTTTELKEEIAVKSEKVSVLVDAAKGTMNSVVDMNAAVRSITDRIITRSESDPQNKRQVKRLTNTADSIIHLPQDLQTINPDAENENYDTLYFGKVR